MGMGKSVPTSTAPTAPTVTEDAVEVEDAEVESQAEADAKEKQRKAAAAARDRAGTVLTGDDGDSTTATTKSTVLGG